MTLMESIVSEKLISWVGGFKFLQGNGGNHSSINESNSRGGGLKQFLGEGNDIKKKLDTTHEY